MLTMDSELMTRIYLKAILGVKKEDAGFPLTPEMEAYWDRTAAWAEKNRAAGMDFEIPWEVPEVLPAPDSPAHKIRAELEGRT